MGFGSRRPMRLSLLNACHRVVYLVWARQHRDWKRVKIAGRNMHKLTVSEVLEHMRQLPENESEKDNDEEIVFSDDEYVPPDEENISFA
ncbi:hypothetical protein TNCV_1437241 [Trichonephila clavipes]|nr:hypothetical protein TNCV_1437241 [Trichonephila clavipes]